MSKAIEWVPLSSVLSTIIDNRGKSVPTVDKGFPLIATNCIKENRIFPTFENIRYVREETLKSWFRAHLKPNDILFVNKGTPGRVCLVPDPVSFCAAQDMIGLRADSTKIDYRYLFAFLRSDWVKQTITNNHVGLAIPHFRKQDIDTLSVPMPSKSEQEKIGGLYLLLSEKIELNHRINVELEGMAKLLYDYWFVQYDFPLSAAQAAALGQPRLTGQPYRSSGGPMVFNPQLKREIPEGWKVGNLLDIAKFTNGIACQKFPPMSDEHLRVIKIKEMHSGFTETSEKVTTEVPEKVIVRDGDILFSWSASLEVMIWTGGKGALNQHIFKVTSENYPRSICYFTLQGYLQHFKMMADQRKTTMGHITREHLEQSRIAIPPKEIGNEFESVTQPVFAQILNNQQQNQELTTLRDWLLPMLMNGQVRVG